MRRMLAAAAAGLVFPAAAQAASVSVHVPPCAPEQSKYGACYPDQARFAAASGEQNKVTVSRSVDPPSYQPRLTITDSGAALHAGAGCTQVDEHTATCTGYNLIANVAAGDGDDSVDGPAYDVDGGPGNDVLTGASVEHGGPGNDTLRGADTGSSLDGGAGRDTISGGSGNDTIVDAANPGEPDVVDGGDGVDTMSYAGRAAGMTVTLQQPLAGEDQLSAIESLRGGNGDDKLTGDAGPNVLEGGPGADQLYGGEGGDTLAGGSGADTLVGEGGDDTLDPGEDRSYNLLDCGPGQDRAEPLPNTYLDWNCERVGIDAFDLGGVVRLHLPLTSVRGPVLTMDPVGCVYLPCSIRLSLIGLNGRAKGVVLGDTRVTRRTKRARLPKRLVLRANKLGQARLRGDRRFDARIRIVVVENGEADVHSFRTTVEVH
jgi:hypothetical protein